MIPPFPALPESENEDDSENELSREILPELVTKEISPIPHCPDDLDLVPESEYEIEFEFKREILPELVAKEISPPCPALPENEDDVEDEFEFEFKRRYCRS
jgi:hypothetical protein